MDEPTELLSRTIGARVKNERQARKWTLDHLAEHAGVSRRMVVNVEQGLANPSVGTLLRLSEALGVSLPALVEPPTPQQVTVTRAGNGATLWTGENGGRGILMASSNSPEALELWELALSGLAVPIPTRRRREQMNNYDDLAAQAEAGLLLPKPGTALRGKAAAEAGQRALMEATGTDTVADATAVALGRPRLDAATPSGVTWKVRTTPDLDREARNAAAAQGVSISQLVRDAVSAHVSGLDLNKAVAKHR